MGLPVPDYLDKNFDPGSIKVFQPGAPKVLNLFLIQGGDSVLGQFLLTLIVFALLALVIAAVRNYRNQNRSRHKVPVNQTEVPIVRTSGKARNSTESSEPTHRTTQKVLGEIFISYASADKEVAESLARALSKQGWAVWWDRTIPPGKTFDEVIESALDSARCVIVLWSSASISSRWVKSEAEEGARRQILVPVLIQEVRIPLAFRHIQAASLIDWNRSTENPEFRRLVSSVTGLIN